MPEQMTRTAWSQGGTNALVAGVSILVLGSAIAAAVSLTSGRPFSDSFGFALQVVFCSTMLVYLGTWLYDRANAGHVLLDCGPFPVRTMFLINGALLVVLALSFVFAVPSASMTDLIFGPVLWASFSALCFIEGTGRLQIRENGIWRYSSLLRWAKISSYHWADNSTLVVRQKGSLPFFKGALPVPPEHREAIEGFLAERSRATRSS
jgi:hypothetical protein